MLVVAVSLYGALLLLEPLLILPTDLDSVALEIGFDGANQGTIGLFGRLPGKLLGVVVVKELTVKRTRL